MGLEFSSPIACLVMDVLSELLSQTEEQSQVLHQLNPIQFEALTTYLKSKYVDDVLVALELLKLGVRWDRATKTLSWSPETENQDREANVHPEVHTMELLCQISSSLISCLKFTWDSPSKNSNNMMPVLDTFIWVGIPKRTRDLPHQILHKGTTLPSINGQLQNHVLYMFYRKPMARDTPLNNRSAIPAKMKVQTASNEFLRRFRNTSREVEKSKLESIIESYVCDLKRGSFPES